MEEIGTIAGKILDYLVKHGPSDTIQIKFSLSITNSQLYLALGWLARENKISITKDKNIHRISIKK
ncbi:unnamed protein product [marine sediment metagenome]|uniref:Winged helix-turn-helix transcription repressor HrcA DNA-binding domain-containing protein n=1 Tax=marine sediment metagenome TaxID=412755 RepID=X1NPT7_9ZZZZ